jgi:hypothetical protein
MIARGLESDGVGVGDGGARPKGDPKKVAVAREVREFTSMTRNAHRLK